MKKILSSKLIVTVFSLSIFMIISIASSLYAHPIDLTNISRAEIGWVYLQMGFTHILPGGIDHILFILGIYCLSPNLKTVFIQATAFTVAHTITLTLSTYDIIYVDSGIVEPIIALSIVFIRNRKYFRKGSQTLEDRSYFHIRSCTRIRFCGSIKGSGTSEVGVCYGSCYIYGRCRARSGDRNPLSIFSCRKMVQRRQWYHQRVVVSASLMIAVIALYWTVERIWY